MNAWPLRCLRVAYCVSLPMWLLPTAAGADVMVPATPAVQTGITVNGHSEVKVKPDVAYLTLSIETTASAEVDAVQGNAAKVQVVMADLTKSNITASDIQTESYNVWPNRDYTANPPVLTGYTVTATLDVTVHDIPKAGVIVDKVTAAGATVDDVTYDLVDKSDVEGEQLAAAVANARSKADLIAGASGVKVGRVLSVTEQSSEQPVAYPGIRMQAMAAATPAPQTQFSPQKIDVTADVVATYAIDYSDQ